MTTRIRYVGDAPEVFVPALDAIVPHGVAFDVADDLAESLLEQPANWQRADGAPGTPPVDPPAGEED